jgi:LacI family transcriptional regulator
MSSPPPEVPRRLAPAGVVIRQSTEVLAIDDADVAEAVRIIRRRATHPIQVDDVVTPTATSRRSLERRFKRTLGRTIAEEITLVRITRAKDLLAHTDLSIADIAPQCGFNYSQQFNATFRKLTNMTPAQYRRQYRVR